MGPNCRHPTLLKKLAVQSQKVSWHPANHSGTTAKIISLLLPSSLDTTKVCVISGHRRKRCHSAFQHRLIRAGGFGVSIFVIWVENRKYSIAKKQSAHSIEAMRPRESVSWFVVAIESQANNSLVEQNPMNRRAIYDGFPQRRRFGREPGRSPFFLRAMSNS